MPDEDLNAEKPDWACTWEHRPDGKTIFRDQGGTPLVALAVTRDELRLLKSGLELLTQNEATTLGLLDRLVGLLEDLDEAAE